MRYSLQDQYDTLTPFERAVVLQEAAAKLDDLTINAASPSTIPEALFIEGFGRIFETIAFHAVHASQNAEILCKTAQAVLSRLENDAVLSKNVTPENLRKMEECEMFIEEGKRRRAAWLWALQALDDTTGTACMTAARITAGDYISRILDKASSKNKDYNAELTYLREMWAAGTRNIPDAPNAA